MGPAKTVDLFKMRILNGRRETALSLLLEPGEPRTAVFINAHAVNMAADDPAFRWAVGKADIRLPGGSGLQLAARLGGGRFVENLNGTDLFVPLCIDAAARAFRSISARVPASPRPPLGRPAGMRPASRSPAPSWPSETRRG